MSEDVYRHGRTYCGRCGRPVIDDTTDFGNGLLLRTTCNGVEFKLRREGPSLVAEQDWTPGISRDELRRFLDGGIS